MAGSKASTSALSALSFRLDGGDVRGRDAGEVGHVDGELGEGLCLGVAGDPGGGRLDKL
jgi:hypothetical protein